MDLAVYYSCTFMIKPTTAVQESMKGADIKDLEQWGEVRSTWNA